MVRAVAVVQPSLQSFISILNPNFTFLELHLKAVKNKLKKIYVGHHIISHKRKREERKKKRKQKQIILIIKKNTEENFYH